MQESNGCHPLKTHKIPKHKMILCIKTWEQPFFDTRLFYSFAKLLQQDTKAKEHLFAIWHIYNGLG